MRRALSIALFALATSASMRASAQPPEPSPVEVRVSTVLGADALLPESYHTLAVTLRNGTAQMFRGRVSIAIGTWGEAPERHVVPVDLPPREERRVRITAFVGATGSAVTARYEADGRTLGESSQNTSYAPAGRSLVVLADPQRLRASLLDLQASVPAEDSGYYGAATGTERAVPVPLGVVSIDARTGDPIVPDDVLGWSSAAVVAAQIPMLARLSDREREALRRWLHAGGSLALMPRTPSDLADPLIREALGELRVSETRRLPPNAFVPAEVAALECPVGTDERFGCAARLGAGTLYVLAYDASSPPHVEHAAVRDLMRSISQRALRDPSPIQLALGRGRDSLAQEWWDGRPSFGRLRAALDPNDGYRPALGLVGIVLLLYIVVVGPLNFRLVLRRNRPTLALLTTPILALACASMMLVVGYVGKGVRMRFRRVEMIEAVEGDSLASTRAYAGYFLTAPSTFDIETRPEGRTMRLRSGGGDDGLVFDHAGERPRLTSMRGGLWETVFLRDDRMIDLGGSIELALEGERLVSVVNRSRQTLHGAFIVDDTRVYAVGDVPAGEQRPIAQSVSTTLTNGWGFDEEANPTARDIAQQLGLDEATARYVRGALRLLGGPSATPSDPVLWARIDPEPPPAASPGFAAEDDLRFLLLRLRPRYSALGLAQTAAANPSGVWGTPGAPSPADLPADAGTEGAPNAGADGGGAP